MDIYILCDTVEQYVFNNIQVKGIADYLSQVKGTQTNKTASVLN